MCSAGMRVHLSPFQKTARVQKYYRDTKGLVLRSVYIDSKMPVRLLLWLLTLLGLIMVLVSLLGAFTEVIRYIGFDMPRCVSFENTFKRLLLFGVFYWFVYLGVRKWHNRQHFQEYYDKYAISLYPFRYARRLLHYALFAEQLETSKPPVSNAEVKNISQWLKTLATPRRQDTFWRHPLGIATLTVTLTDLVTIGLERFPVACATDLNNGNLPYQCSEAFA
jgi:hypothetical protein